MMRGSVSRSLPLPKNDRESLRLHGSARPARRCARCARRGSPSRRRSPGRRRPARRAARSRREATSFSPLSVCVTVATRAVAPPRPSRARASAASATRTSRRGRAGRPRRAARSTAAAASATSAGSPCRTDASPGTITRDVRRHAGAARRQPVLLARAGPALRRPPGRMLVAALRRIERIEAVTEDAGRVVRDE